MRSAVSCFRPSSKPAGDGILREDGRQGKIISMLVRFFRTGIFCARVSASLWAEKDLSLCAAERVLSVRGNTPYANLRALRAKEPSWAPPSEAEKDLSSCAAERALSARGNTLYANLRALRAKEPSWAPPSGVEEVCFPVYCREKRLKKHAVPMPGAACSCIG